MTAREKLVRDRKYRNKSYLKIRSKCPWLYNYDSSKNRCTRKDHPYFKKCIKFLMTKDEFKFLWFRDSAYLLKKPSIDRIDSSGNYILNNCIFIELHENLSVKGHLNSRTKLTITEVIDIREKFELGCTKMELARFYNVSQSNIGAIINRVSWRYI